MCLTYRLYAIWRSGMFGSGARKQDDARDGGWCDVIGGYDQPCHVVCVT